MIIFPILVKLNSISNVINSSTITVKCSQDITYLSVEYFTTAGTSVCFTVSVEPLTNVLWLD